MSMPKAPIFSEELTDSDLSFIKYRPTPIQDISKASCLQLTLLVYELVLMITLSFTHSLLVKPSNTARTSMIKGNWIFQFHQIPFNLTDWIRTPYARAPGQVCFHKLTRRIQTLPSNGSIIRTREPEYHSLPVGSCSQSSWKDNTIWSRHQGRNVGKIDELTHCNTPDGYHNAWVQQKLY